MFEEVVAQLTARSCVHNHTSATFIANIYFLLFVYLLIREAREKETGKFQILRDKRYIFKKDITHYGETLGNNGEPPFGPHGTKIKKQGHPNGRHLMRQYLPPTGGGEPPAGVNTWGQGPAGKGRLRKYVIRVTFPHPGWCTGACG